jgi:DNA-binding MarR family transcriptional regulator
MRSAAKTAPAPQTQYAPTGLRLAFTFKRYLAELDKHLSHFDIERYFYAILLLSKPENEGCCQQDLANLLQIDKASLVRVLDYLSEHGYLTRDSDPTDRRRYKLRLTEKGRKAAPEIEAAYRAADEKAFEGFTPEQRALFTQLLEKMETNLEDEAAKSFFLTFTRSRRS